MMTQRSALLDNKKEMAAEISPPVEVGHTRSMTFGIRGVTFAHLISQVVSPPLITTLMVVLVVHLVNTPGTWAWAIVYVLLALILPLSYLFWLVRRGEVTDLDVQLREQRMKPLVFTLLSAGMGCLILCFGGAAQELIILTGSLWVQTVVLFSITTWWKISIHTTVAANAAMLLWYILGTPLFLAVGVPIVAWSRVRLGRHTVNQAVAGVVLGLIIGWLTIVLIYGG